MKVFTYKDYIRCIHTLRLNEAFKLAEESSKYVLNQEKIEKEKKKILKNMLKDKRKMAIFINDFLETNEKIESKNLIKYDNNYISKKYKIDERKLIYKLKNKEFFYLVEEVEELDNIVLYEILNYCISIMQEWNITNKIRGENKYPVIVPIIIYTGKKKINLRNKKQIKQMEDYIFKNYNLGLNYNLIDINKISISFLQHKSSVITYVMLQEKLKNEKASINKK